MGRVAAKEFMTTADRLRAEGEARGLKKGEIFGKRSSLLLLLRLRFGRVPAATTARINKARSAALDTWCCRVLTASSVDEVVGTRTRRKA